MLRWVIAAVGLVLLTTLIATTALADRLWGLAAPPAGLSTTLSGRRPGAGDDQTRREEHLGLQADNARLRARLADYQAVPGEDILVRWEPVGRGAITARSARLGRRYVELDLGADRGAAPGMAVMAGGALIGTIAGIRPGRSLVQLISDSAARLPASLIDPKDPTVLAQGVIAGTGRAGVVRLDLIEDREGLSVLPGMLVATSGSGTLPAGLVIGTVVTAVRPGAGADTDGHWRIDVRPLRSAEQEDSLLVVRVGQARRQR